MILRLWNHRYDFLSISNCLILFFSWLLLLNLNLHVSVWWWGLIICFRLHLCLYRSLCCILCLWFTLLLLCFVLSNLWCVLLIFCKFSIDFVVVSDGCCYCKLLSWWFSVCVGNAGGRLRFLSCFFCKSNGCLLIWLSLLLLDLDVLWLRACRVATSFDDKLDIKLIVIGQSIIHHSTELILRVSMLFNIALYLLRAYHFKIVFNKVPIIFWNHWDFYFLWAALSILCHEWEILTLVLKLDKRWLGWAWHWWALGLWLWLFWRCRFWFWWGWRCCWCFINYCWFWFLDSSFIGFFVGWFFFWSGFCSKLSFWSYRSLFSHCWLWSSFLGNNCFWFLDLHHRRSRWLNICFISLCNLWKSFISLFWSCNWSNCCIFLCWCRSLNNLSRLLLFVDLLLCLDDLRRNLLLQRLDINRLLPSSTSLLHSRLCLNRYYRLLLVLLWVLKHTIDINLFHQLCIFILWSRLGIFLGWCRFLLNVRYLCSISDFSDGLSWFSVINLHMAKITFSKGIRVDSFSGRLCFHFAHFFQMLVLSITFGRKVDMCNFVAFFHRVEYLLEIFVNRAIKVAAVVWHQMWVYCFRLELVFYVFLNLVYWVFNTSHWSFEVAVIGVTFSFYLAFDRNVWLCYWLLFWDGLNLG